MEICNEISTENLVKSHDKEVAKLQHLYNYQRTENANKQLDLENARNRIIIFFIGGNRHRQCCRDLALSATRAN